MAAQAELCELALRKVLGNSSRLEGCFPESSGGCSWPPD